MADDDEGGPEVAESVSFELVEDRAVHLSTWQGGAETEEQLVQITDKNSQGTEVAAAFFKRIAEICFYQTFESLDWGTCTFSTTDSCATSIFPPGPLGSVFETDGTPNDNSATPLLTTLIFNCAAHYAQMIADSQEPVYIGNLSGSLMVNSQTISNGFVGRLPPEVSSATYSVSPSSTSDRASWALLATDLFREGVEAGTNILASADCTASLLQVSCSSSENPLHQKDLRETITANLADAMAGSVESAEKAAKYLHASAQAKFSGGRDRANGRKAAWRDPYDSLLRAASAYVSISDDLYNDVDPITGEITADADANFSAITAVVATDGDRLAEDLLREHKVDIRRSVSTIANDLFASINAEADGAYDGLSSTELLAAQGIELADVERAARRIQQEIAVLGKVVAHRTENGLRRLYGIDKEIEPASPFYLYDRTEGRAFFGESDPTTLNGSEELTVQGMKIPSVAYARHGVFHAMDYFLSRYEHAIRDRSDVEMATPRLRRLLSAAYDYAGRHVQGRLLVSVCEGCNGTTKDGYTDYATVTVIEAGEPPVEGNGSAEMVALVEKYDLWLGLEGLLCATKGVNAFGEPCEPREHKIYDHLSTGSTVKFSSTAPLEIRYPYFQIKREGGLPFKPGSTTETVAWDDVFGPASPTQGRPTFYLTRAVKDAAGAVMNVPIAAIPIRPSTVSWGAYYIPISSSLAEALTETLGVDPLNPSETMMMCGKSGIPRNIKLGLEDELLASAGANRSDTVEESWQYYLGLADAAASEADALGNELVEQGLRMDQIAEDARDELEALCGGVVNVGDLRDRVCEENQCDLIKFLNNASDSAEVQQLKQCLGTGEQLVDAVAADVPTCWWQVDGLKPGKCPTDDSSCPGRIPTKAEENEWAKAGNYYSHGPVALARGESPAGFTDASCKHLFVPPEDEEEGFPSTVKFHAIANTLNLLSTDARPDAPPKYSCAEIAKLRAGMNIDKDLGPTLGFSRSSLANLAERLSVKRDDLNFVEIFLDKDRKWLATAGEPSDPWGITQDFPCNKHPGASDLSCSSNAQKRSLSCGVKGGAAASALSCPSGGTNAEKIAWRQDAGERLARAVELLKQLTGTGMKGVEVATITPGAPVYAEDWDYELALNAQDYQFEVEPDELSIPRHEFSFESVLPMASLNRSLQANAPCAINRWRRKGQSKGTNFCVDPHDFRSGISGGDGKDEWEIFEFGDNHGTWIHQQGGSKTVPIHETCIGPAIDDPNVPAGVSEERRLALPPKCDWGDEHGARHKYMLFLDAGDLASWPVLGDEEVAALWAKKGKTPSPLSRLLERALDEASGNLAQPRKVEPGAGTMVARNSEPLSRYSYDDLLDAFELACLAQTPNYDEVDCPNLSEADFEVRSLDDFGRTKKALRCQADQVEDAARTMTFRNMPKPLVKAIRKRSLAALSDKFGGAHAQTATKLYNAVLEIGKQHIMLASAVRDMSNAYSQTEQELKIIKYSSEIESERAAMGIALADQRCRAARQRIAAAAASGGIQGALNAGDGKAVLGFAMGALASGGAASFEAVKECEASKIAKKHEAAIAEIGTKKKDAELVAALTRLSASLSAVYERIGLAALSLQQNYADAQAALSELATQRQQAHVAAAKVLMLDNDDVGHEFNTTTAMRARMNTLRVQYERARDYAIRMTYLARRSVEQKIGLDLSSMHDDVGWVEAPAKWADSVCALRGINYDKNRANDAQQNMERRTGGSFNYADQYVGTYVNRLQELVTAYVNTYASHDGNDVAVVSVRDELAGLTNTACDVQGPNELRETYACVNEAPFGMSRDDKEAFLDPGIWESPVGDDGVRVQALAAIDESPFVAYGVAANGASVPASDDPLSLIAASDKPEFGALGNVVQAVRLNRIVGADGGLGGVEGGAGPAPMDPPTSGLEMWYRADSCTETTPDSGLVASCTDRSGHIRPATAQGGIQLVSSGIGGQPAFEITYPLSGSPAMYAPYLPSSTTRFTLSYVSRVIGPNMAFMFAPGSPYSHDLRGGGTQALFNITGTSGNSYLAIASPVLPSLKSQLGQIVTIVADGASGMRYFINGQMVHHAEQIIVPPTILGGTIFANMVGASGNVTAKMSEWMAYGRALDDDEIAHLHRYLANRYGVDTSAPYAWIEADDVARMAANNGISDVSGYQGSANTVTDRGTGWNRGGHGSGSLPALTTFGGGHYGLTFDPGDVAYYLGTTRSSAYLPPGGPGTPTDYAGPDDHTVVVVGRVDASASHTLVEGGGATADNPVAWGLYANGANGSIVLRRWVYGSANVDYATSAGVLTLGEPYVITLRSSFSRNLIELHVNGQRVLGVEGAGGWRTGGLGGGSGQTIAEYRHYWSDFSDARLLALHEELAEKYGIDLSSDIPTDPDPPAVSGTPTYRQHVTLPNGTWMLSWYEQGSDVATTPVFEPTVVADDGEEVALTPGGKLVSTQERWLAPGWQRRWVTFSSSGGHFVGWKVPEEADGFLFAAPQLERIDAVDESQPPAPFWPTDDDEYAPFGVCEDEGGVQFRAQAWSSGCETYCPASFANCAEVASDPSKLTQRCYHELKFHLDQDELEKGNLLSQGGFAAGNFNYRWEEVAVNVVGTSVKDCGNSETASACYANNFLQYSLRHDGPFLVRNYLGRDYQAPLYPGRIQQSKALMAERYLTNPLSGADRGLLGDFWDYEFVGRPLDGSYTLRIYDTDGLNWDAVEDIQLLVHYRYWTRLN